MPCPVCRSKIEDISKWKNTQEKTLRLQRVEKFSKVKQRFFSNVMRNKNQEIVRLRKRIKKNPKEEGNKYGN